MSASHDEEYAAVVERERPLILASAYLLTGDPAQAERVVQLVFAELYGRWLKVLDLRLESLRAVVNAARAPVDLPWDVRERIELIDGPAPAAAGRRARRTATGWGLGTLTYSVGLRERRYGRVGHGDDSSYQSAPTGPIRVI